MTSLALVLLCVATMGGADAAEAQTGTHAGVRIPSAEEVVLAERNSELLAASRAEHGLTPLQRHPQLDLLAYQHASEMAQRGQVTHFSHLTGVGTKTRVQLAFPRLPVFAENIARNRSPEALHASLMESSGHRANRLDPRFTHVGIGVARGGPYELYLTEIFVRATSAASLESIALLYNTAASADLPREESSTGEVVRERYTVPPPDDDDPEYWTLLGINAYTEGRYVDAVRAFRRALEINPAYGYARYDLGRALIAAGRAGEASVELERYLASAPDDADGWSAAGTAALLGARYGAAEEAFRRVLRQRARDAGTWYNLGLALEYQNRLDDAAGAYSQALFLDPGLAEARLGLRRVRG